MASTYVRLPPRLPDGWLTFVQIRDLRKIDSRIPNLVPTILVRKESILVNILHLRALIKADAVVLFDTYGSVDSRLHSTFLYHLQVSMSSSHKSLVRAQNRRLFANSC